jgi:hypothetical protein
VVETRLTPGIQVLLLQMLVVHVKMSTEKRPSKSMLLKVLILCTSCQHSYFNTIQLSKIYESSKFYDNSNEQISNKEIATCSLEIHISSYCH